MEKEPEKKPINDKVIKDALEKAGAVRNCPRCNHHEFKILNGFFAQSLQTNTLGVQVGGNILPTIVVVCARCGFVSQYSVEILLGVTQIEEVRH
jgi:hypothetical protein